MKQPKEHLKKDVDMWHKVNFSDECKIELHSNKKKETRQDSHHKGNIL